MDTLRNIANQAGRGVMSFCNTNLQMGKNLVDDPMKFITKDGLATSGQALKNGAARGLDYAEKRLDNFINDSVEINGRRVDEGPFVPVGGRELEKNARNGDRSGSWVRNSFKQHSFNLVAPGEKNHLGGSFELIG